MGTDQQEAPLSRPVMCRKQTVSWSPLIIVNRTVFHHYIIVGLFLNILVHVQGGTVQSKSYSFISSSNTTKKVGRWLMKLFFSLKKKKKSKIPPPSQINLIWTPFLQCLWSWRWHIVTQRWLGCCGPNAGRAPQRADEGTDHAEDVCHAGPQGHDREAREGGRRVRRGLDTKEREKEFVKVSEN